MILRKKFTGEYSFRSIPFFFLLGRLSEPAESDRCVHYSQEVSIVEVPYSRQCCIYVLIKKY